MNASFDSARYRNLVEKTRLDEVEEGTFLNLCAYDNVLSATAAGFLSIGLGNRYRLGTFPDGMAPGTDSSKLLLRQFDRVNELERAAHEALLDMLGGVAADLRPLSGVHATTSLILSSTDVGDAVYSIPPECGGHFATRHVVERAGRVSRYLAWDALAANLDLEGIAKQFEETKPLFILLDHGAPLFPLPLKRLRDVAGPSALIAYDASHTMGLIAGGVFQDPLKEGCDVLHSNTHKSFPGPQKALIVFRDGVLARRVQASLDAGLVSSQHTHHVIALCVTILEMKLWARPYADQMVANASALAHALHRRGLIDGASPFLKTESHLIFVPMSSWRDGRRWFQRLQEAHVATNLRTLFGQPVLRLGVQKATCRGAVEEDMGEIAAWFGELASGGSTALLREKVIAKRRSQERVHYSFDDDSPSVSKKAGGFS